MNIYTRRVGDTFIIRLCGELDASTSESVEKILDEVVLLEPQQIQVDCKELTYISSWGIGVFISRFQVLKDRQVGFFLFNLSDQVLYVFRVLGLEELMDLRSGKQVPTS